MRVGASFPKGFGSIIRIVSLCLYDSVVIFDIVAPNTRASERASDQR